MRIANELFLRAYIGWQRINATHLQERGQTLAEYGLIVSVVAVGVVVPPLLIFRDVLGGAFLGANGCLVGSC